MRLIDADAEILKIETEIKQYEKRIQEWEENAANRGLYDVDLKIRELQRNITDCKVEIKTLRMYETVSLKKIRDKAIDEFLEKAMKQFIGFDLKHLFLTVPDCKMILRKIAEQMKEVGK